jgi:hypothetical protein
MMRAECLQDQRTHCACGRALAAALAAALAGGCAGGAWLDNPLPGESASNPPQNGYPTAIGSASNKATAATAMPLTTNPNAAEQAAAGHTASAATTQAPANGVVLPPSQRDDHAPPPRAALAVIPQQYVRTAGTTTAAVPAAAYSASSQPANAPASNTSQTSAATALPQLDLSFLDALATAPAVARTAATSSTIATPSSANDSTTEKQAVKQASYEANEAAPHHETFERAQSALIDALEAEIRRRRDAGTADEELPRLEQQLRLVYAAAGRMDDAVAAVESLDPSQREAYKNLMFGLGVWLSPDEARRAALRTAKVLHSLRDATGDLAGASKLELRNLAFCERVEHFGWYTEFPRKEFQPKQQVILYAEVENFTAEQKGPSSYETELQGSYVILDASGQEVASRQLQLDKEVCRNYRRDYFLAYRLYLPDGISPGRYRLELTVEDMKARGKYQGRKLGEGVIDFTIR